MLGLEKLPVRLGNAADIVKNRYRLLPTWCYVKSICYALFEFDDGYQHVSPHYNGYCNSVSWLSGI